MSELEQGSATGGASPDVLTRALTPKQILLGFIAGALLLAAVIVPLTRESSAPPRLPETPPSDAFALMEDPRQIGLSGDSVEVEGELVAKDHSEDLPVLWISGEQFGGDPETGLAYAVPLRVYDDSQLTYASKKMTPATAISRLLGRDTKTGPVRLSGTVKVVGHSIFVVSCVVDEPARTP